LSDTRPVGLIMPAYNAASTILPTIDRIPLAALRGAGLEPTLYVVDDGCTDGTPDRLTELGDEPPLPVVLLTHPANRGYGAAQKTGLRRSLADGNLFHVLLHSDGQYAPEELPLMFEPLASGRAEVVIGSKFVGRGRFVREIPLPRLIGIVAIDWIENRVFGLKDMEFHSGYMGYASPVIEAVPLERLRDRFHFDGEMVLSTAHLGFRIVRVPISATYGGTVSSLKPLPYLKEVLEVLRTYRRGGFWFQQEGR